MCWFSIILVGIICNLNLRHGCIKSITFCSFHLRYCSSYKSYPSSFRLLNSSSSASDIFMDGYKLFSLAVYLSVLAM